MNTLFEHFDNIYSILIMVSFIVLMVVIVFYGCFKKDINILKVRKLIIEDIEKQLDWMKRVLDSETNENYTFEVSSDMIQEYQNRISDLIDKLKIN